MAILVTGGAGYIGSHTVVELQNAGYDVVVLDNLSNASEKALDRVSKITGKPVKFYKADILDRDALNDIFDKETIESCIHFAGLKAVGESVVKPWEYYENNIAGTLTLGQTDYFALLEQDFDGKISVHDTIPDFQYDPKNPVLFSVLPDLWMLQQYQGMYLFPAHVHNIVCLN